MQKIEYTHTRISKPALAKAKKIVAKKKQFASVAHLLEMLIEKEAVNG